MLSILIILYIRSQLSLTTINNAISELLATIVGQFNRLSASKV
ncbi:hypothetical protein DSUL_40080 [Desulfovibrionales bacterium]